MKRTLVTVLLVLIVGGIALGFYRGWFAMSSGRNVESHKVNVNLTMDPDKVKEDAGKLQDKTTELSGKATKGAKELGAQARDKVKSNDE